MSIHTQAIRESLKSEMASADILPVIDLVRKNILFVEDGNHGQHRPRQNEFVAKGGIPFIRPPDLKDGRVDFENCGFINESGFARVRKGIGRPGDIILTHRATVGRMAITGSDAPSVFVTNPGTTIWRSLDQKVLNQRYLYFYMNSSLFLDRLLSEVGHTSTFDYVSLTQQRGLPVLLPPIDQQVLIANILGSIDDKINLNYKIIDTLDNAVKALFKSWFLDFDPTILKAKGEPTGWPNAIDALFPDSLEQSEIGEIPSGWKLTSVYDLADYINGASHSSKILNTSRLGYPVIKINELKNGFTDQTKYWNEEFKEKHLIKNGDILFSWSGNPDTSIGTFIWSKNDGLLNQHIFKVKPLNREWRSFIISVLRSNQRVFADIARNKQTTGLGHVTVKDLKEMMCPTAPDTVMKAFANATDDILQRSQNSTLEIDLLTDLRDVLLPKLISGELRIPDAEKMLEEVGI